MALIATVTKQSVSKLNEDDYQITIHMVIVDELEAVLLEKDYSERYYSATSVGAVKTKLQDQIVSDWDELISEADIFDAAAFDTMVLEIQTAANNYVNT